MLMPFALSLSKGLPFALSLSKGLPFALSLSKGLPFALSLSKGRREPVKPGCSAMAPDSAGSGSTGLS
jgi:hypothetical protein